MNRIYFAGNPWPDGHRIKAFAWSGRLEPGSGLWFDFDLDYQQVSKEPAPFSIL
ncbi:UNVERIFIED_CONTAM: hypothetical protein ABID98_000189 [Brevibacillus sp. OAP136]